ncbi:MAG: DUF6232 family protein [Polyangiaceae bacterium]
MRLPDFAWRCPCHARWDVTFLSRSHRRETTYYADQQGVRITNTRAIFGSVTYPVADLTSVEAARVSPNRVWAWITMALGALLVLGGTFSSCTCAAVGWPEAALFSFAVFGVLGGGVFTGGLVWNQVLKDTFVVRITTAGGDADALASHDQRHIEAIVNALNHALIQRG